MANKKNVNYENSLRDKFRKEKIKKILDDNKSDMEVKIERITLVISVILFAVSFIPGINLARDIIRLISIVFASYPALEDAVSSLIHKEIDETLLMVIAVIAAMFIGEFPESAAIAILFRIGELLEDYASYRSMKSIKSLLSIVNDTAHLVLEDGGTEIIESDEIKVGMKLAVMPHEIIPVDGVIYKGASSIDTSALTGESLPLIVGIGDTVSSGCVNGSSEILIEATASKNESAAERIISMVSDAAEMKGKTESLVTVFAKYYTPTVIVAAFAVAILGSLVTKDFRTWLHNAIVVLMASCPCAIVISVPLSFLTSMGACAKNGMIIKGSSFIEAIAGSKTVVFDKTGTLTTDTPIVGDVFAVPGYTEDDVLKIAAKCEFNSAHPIAKAIVTSAGVSDDEGITDYTEVAGGGVSVTLNEGKAICGGNKLMSENGIVVTELPEASVYVALNGVAIGCINIVNPVRSTSKSLVSSLRKLGVEKLVMLTGDKKANAEKICKELSLDECKYELLPENKLSALEGLKSGENKVIYIGDGINDAPVLAAADTGIAMGLGTQAACEAADVILTDGNLMRIADTVKHSRRTVKNVKINIIFSLVVKAAVIILGILSLAPTWLAVLADVGTMIICVINSSRLLRVHRMANSVTADKTI